MTEEERNQLQTGFASMTFGDLCAAYVKLRDGKKAAEAELDKRLTKVKFSMEAIENQLLKTLMDQSADSIATPYGTCYRKAHVHYKVKDRAAFMRWAHEQGAMHALDIRASKAALDEIVTETGELPPGIDRSGIFKVNIRRSTNA